MSIKAVDAPVRKRTGREPRLSEEDVKDIADTLKAGKWASEDELVPTKSAAYQRAKAAIKLVGERYQITNLTSAVTETTQTGANGKPLFQWQIGPLPEGTTRRRSGRKPAEAKAS